MSDLRLSDRISVHDGDTPIVNGERMRMVFGDAPEVADERKQQPAAVGATEARQALAQAMLDVLNKPPVAEQAEIQAYLDRTFSFAKMMEGYLAVVRDVETGAPSSSASS